MKVFGLRQFTAVVPAWHLRNRIGQKVRRAVGLMAELNARVDAARARRDRSNHANECVDGAFWIYLR